MGAILVLVFHRPRLGLAISALGLFLFIVGQFYSPIAYHIEHVNRRVLATVASALAWILLAPFYLVFFSIGHALLALRGRDPLCRNSTTDESTYWLPVVPESSREDYRRQY